MLQYLFQKLFHSIATKHPTNSDKRRPSAHDHSSEQYYDNLIILGVPKTRHVKLKCNLLRSVLKTKV